jgi:hypothetical protein
LPNSAARYCGTVGELITGNNAPEKNKYAAVQGEVDDRKREGLHFLGNPAVVRESDADAQNCEQVEDYGELGCATVCIGEVQNFVHNGTD